MNAAEELEETARLYLLLHGAADAVPDDPSRSRRSPSNTPFPDPRRRKPMPRLAANLSLMFNEIEFLDRFAAAPQTGLHGRRVPVPLCLAQGRSWPRG